MAAHVVVIDTSFRRATIKVTQGKFVSDILDEACNHFKLTASNYGLKHNNKPVDLSRTFRQTGLTSGAKLELVLASKSPSVVSVALQLPEPEAKDVPGGRLLDKFPSNTTFWMILRKFEAAGTANLNFTGRGVAQTSSGDSGAGRIVYETPVLNVMGRELSSLTELQSTLAQKGLSGSCLIRLSFRKTDIPLQEAMEEIKQYMKSVEEPVAPGATSAFVADTQSTPSGEAAAPSPDDVSGEPTPTRSDTTPIDPPPSSTPSSNAPPVLTPTTPSEASTPSDTIFGPNQRPITVFAAPSSHTPQAALNPHNESDYEPTVAHAKLHQQSLQNRSHNQRLLSDAELQRQTEERAAKQAAIKDVTIKVRFPDQLSVVSNFTALDSGASLYEFVCGVIVADDQPFALVWSSSKGPQTIPNDSKIGLIKDLGFAGRMLVNFNWAEGASEEARSGRTLKDAFASKAKELQVQQIAAAEVQDQEDQAASAAKDEEKKTSGSGKSKGGVPKWLKLPGKK